MKNLIKYIFTSTVVIALLFSSSGFDVYKHICTTHNFNAASIFGIPECEKDNSKSEALDDCCKTEVDVIVEQNCCDSELDQQTNPISISSIDVKCCFTSLEEISRTENLFPPVEKRNILIDFTSIVVPTDQIENNQKKERLNLTNNDLPPPLFGKKFLQAVHQLKLNTPIC